MSFAWACRYHWGGGRRRNERWEKRSEERGHLQSLFDLLDEHVAIRRKAVHGQHRTIRSDAEKIGGSTDGVDAKKERDRVQSEDFGCISRLDAVALALPGISCDNTEIGPCDSQNGSAILCVRVELPLIRIVDVCDHGWHLSTVRCSKGGPAERVEGTRDKG